METLLSSRFLLADHAPDAVLLSGGCTLSADAADGKTRTFSGIAHSGQPFNWKGRRAVVDFAGIRFKDKMPVLLDHDRAQRAGAGCLKLENHRLTVSGSLLNNETARDIAACADAGFPWEMSIDARPARIDELKAGERAVINGQELYGPLLVLRAPTIREVSFTATGADANTTAAVFNDSFNDGDNDMDLQQALAEIERLTAENAKLSETLKKLEKARAEAGDAEAAAQNNALKASLEKLQAENRSLQLAAKLADAGFSKDGKGGFAGLSTGSLQVLLTADAAAQDALIADLRRTEVPPVLLSAAAADNPAFFNENPLIADARRRAAAQKGL